MLLVLVDRKSRFVALEKLQSAYAAEVVNKTKSILKRIKMNAYTITNDNGSEFRGCKETGYKVFYCTPHHPQERGTVENSIGLMRQYIKKDHQIDNIVISSVENKINLRPRKVLDYQTPYEVFYKKKVALAMLN
jgi:IS30 family transposase